MNALKDIDVKMDNTNHLPGRLSETSQVGMDVSTLRNYGYDSVNQLTSETVSQNGQTTQSKNYAYDQMGNRTQKTYQNGSDPLHTVSYTTNSLNQTTGVSNTDGTTTTQSTFSYDANGNTTQVSGDNSSTQYSYDDADRLNSIVYKNAQGVNVSKSTFVYDGSSRLRVTRQYNWDTQANEWSQQSEKRRVYDGMDVIQERDGNNTVTNSYTRNGNIGGILAMVHYTPDGSGGFTSDKYFYHYDGRGNVTQLTNDSQNVVAKYTYDAFGNTTASGAAAELNQYRFSTKEEIKGLYYYGYRFYSPGLGKWINRDPIGESGGLNLYAVFLNSPVNISDRYGLDTAWDVGADWFNETNRNGRIYGPENEITVELMKDEGVAWARGEWKKRGCTPGKNMNYHFGAKEYMRELWERDATGSFLGSYAVRFYPQPCGKVRVVVENMSGWESATRSPIPRAGENPSIEDLVTGKNTQFKNARGPRSILNNRDRSQFGPGGDFTQYYTWIESGNCGCEG